ncbi:uncharacterized protein LOC143574078 [Bidens hawaiensis]|uniref:uncharacterized protein LOC143574078 n=1 Tax=Bidens hawaiensis TaxID=980011 RepID=UPI00404B6739
MLNHKDQPSYSITPVHDDQPELQDERTYECTYCKHGFTNAQALGGHMNVHRIERAKNRLDSTNNTSSTRLSEPWLITSCSHDHKQERITREFMLTSSQVLYDSNNLSKYQNPNYGSAIFTGPISRDEVRLSLSLSLQFDRSHEEEGIQGADELDLELRLG